MLRLPKGLLYLAEPQKSIREKKKWFFQLTGSMYKKYYPWDKINKEQGRVSLLYTIYQEK